MKRKTIRAFSAVLCACMLAASLSGCATNEKENFGGSSGSVTDQSSSGSSNASGDTGTSDSVTSDDPVSSDFATSDEGPGISDKENTDSDSESADISDTELAGGSEVIENIGGAPVFPDDAGNIGNTGNTGNSGNTGNTGNTGGTEVKSRLTKKDLTTYTCRKSQKVWNFRLSVKPNSLSKNALRRRATDCLMRVSLLSVSEREICYV